MDLTISKYLCGLDLVPLSPPLKPCNHISVTTRWLQFRSRSDTTQAKGQTQARGHRMPPCRGHIISSGGLAVSATVATSKRMQRKTAETVLVGESHSGSASLASVSGPPTLYTLNANTNSRPDTAAIQLALWCRSCLPVPLDVGDCGGTILATSVPGFTPRYRLRRHISEDTPKWINENVTSRDATLPYTLARVSPRSTGSGAAFIPGESLKLVPRQATCQTTAIISCDRK
jgi:hypothetical protein